VIYHKIKVGETIGGIAEAYKVSVSSIKEWNNIGGNKIIGRYHIKDISRFYSRTGFERCIA